MNKDNTKDAAETFQTAFSAFEAGHTEYAIKKFQEVLELDPGNTDALYLLAVIAFQEGEALEALETVTEAIASRPDSADCHNLHGLALMALGRHEEACAALQQAIVCDPDFAEAVNNLGAALEALGRLDDAEATYRRATALNPGYPQAFCNLGRILLSIGRPAEAEDASKLALALQPTLFDAELNLVVAQQRQGKLAEAEATIQKALTADTENAALHRYLGVLRHNRGDLGGAETALNEALQLQPAFAEAHDNLAGVRLDQGQTDAAEACFREALNLNPSDARAHSNLLLCQNYHATNANILFGAHTAWAERHSTFISPLRPATDRADSPKLRIGYISSDFRRHSVAYFFEPLLSHRDQDRFEVFCYANLENPDATTARMQTACDQWRWIAGLNDNQLAAQIRADEIDILVDLSGHTAGNRLLVFPRRPAPVQATWMGYPNTTGLKSIDYRVTDAVADPPGMENLATETLLRLDTGFLSYQPPDDAPEVGPLPAKAAGRITFGSFNNLRKITPAVVEAWAKILHRVPNSKLIMKARPLADTTAKTQFSQAFESHEIDAERVTLRGPVASPTDHLGSYSEIDIAFDPFPYNGTTTTCEALWMGVPVITLAGDRHAGRVGASLLTQIGHNAHIATSQEEYIEIAAQLASNLDGLSKMRSELRENLRRSTLCDGAGFCRRMESAYEHMWQEKQR